MNKPKIMYSMSSLSHKRVFEEFANRDDCEQICIGPVHTITSNIVPEDYSDFKINVLEYKSVKNIQSFVNEFCPNIYVQSDLSSAHNIKLPDKCKRVFVSHGMVGNHVIGIIKLSGFGTNVWKGFDLYCGATKVFEEWIKHTTKVDANKILLNALPQLDIVYDSKYYNELKKSILGKIGFNNPKHIILFTGFCCKDRFDFNDHNEDYFITAIALSEWARNNDSLVMIKPRHTYGEMIKFLNSHSWGKKYIDNYKKIYKNKNVHFITTTGHIYRYFFADAFVINGCSTVEIEVCAINKPLFVVRTKDKDLCINNYDPYNTVSSGAGKLCKSDASLISGLNDYFKNYDDSYKQSQINLLKSVGISFDGKMHERIQNKLVTL